MQFCQAQCFKQLFNASNGQNGYKFSSYHQMIKLPNCLTTLIVENMVDCINFQLSNDEMQLLISLLNKYSVYIELKSITF